MNTTTTTDPTTAPPPPQPPRSSFSCERHPIEQFTGFCPSCLCERLTTLDSTNNSSNNTPSSSRRPSSATSAIKSLFSSKGTNINSSSSNLPPKPSKPTSFFPELRRTKSFSASKNEALGLSFEPQRKSCDVRVRSTLSTLFTLDKSEGKGGGGGDCASTDRPSSSNKNQENGVKVESCVAKEPVFEECENEEEFRDVEDGDGDDVFVDGEEGFEIRPVLGCGSESLRSEVGVGVNSGEIVEEEEEVVSVANLKPMKDHIDLDVQEKKSSGGRFWSAASVFSKKWHKWRRKQKIKKENSGEKFATMPVEKPISRQFRETQSEIADYGYGRRSCDTDPRFSLDVGRISFDDARYSFDEPRASWDGHLIGKSFPRMAPPMVSVMEDAPVVHVPRSDMQIPVEEHSNEDEVLPGGSVQTRDYYLDSSSKRRKSLDRSSSIRKTAASVVAEVDELKMASNTEVSPAVGEKDLRDSNSNFHGDDCCSETFELSSGFRDSINSSIGEKKDPKKSRRWSWRIWGFIHRRNGGNKDEDDEEERYSRVNGIERSLSESWNGDVRGGFNRNMLRSNSSVSWRNGNSVGGSLGSVRKSSFELGGNGKKRNEIVLEKNRSARYSPNHFDNGLLRFYLTPMGSSRRGGFGKIKPGNSHSIARNVLRLY